MRLRVLRDVNAAVMKMTFIIAMRLPVCALSVSLWCGPALALTPLTTDDSSTLEDARTQVELTSTVSELQLTLQSGLSDRVQWGMSFGVLERAFARDPGIQVKWRLLEHSADQGVAVRLSRSPAVGSARSASEALLAFSERFGASGLHLNAGATCSDAGGAWSSYTSAMLTTAAHDEALLAVELAVADRLWSSPRAVGKAALVEPLSDATALSFDIAPEYAVGDGFAVSGTVALTLGIDLGRQ